MSAIHICLRATSRRVTRCGALTLTYALTAEAEPMPMSDYEIERPTGQYVAIAFLRWLVLPVAGYIEFPKKRNGRNEAIAAAAAGFVYMIVFVAAFIHGYHQRHG